MLHGDTKRQSCSGESAFWRRGYLFVTIDVNDNLTSYLTPEEKLIQYFYPENCKQRSLFVQLFSAIPIIYILQETSYKNHIVPDKFSLMHCYLKEAWYALDRLRF